MVDKSIHPRYQGDNHSLSCWERKCTCGCLIVQSHWSAPAEGPAEMETQIAVVSSLMKSDIHLLLQLDPADYKAPHDRQWKDEDVKQIVKYLECTW